MVSTYHDSRTKVVSERGKKVKKEQLLDMYLVERKRMSCWYIRLLNGAVLNLLIIYRQDMRHHSKLDFRIQLVESLFIIFVSVGEEAQTLLI